MMLMNGGMADDGFAEQPLMLAFWILFTVTIEYIVLSRIFQQSKARVITAVIIANCFSYLAGVMTIWMLGG